MRASMWSCDRTRATRDSKGRRARERFGTELCMRYVALGLTAAFADTIAIPVYAQNAQLASGIVTGAVSCSPSNNGTAHLVCAQYSTAGAVVGASWQSLPGGVENTPGVEPRGQVDPITVTAAGMTLIGPPACAQMPVNDPNIPQANEPGTAAGCLVISSAGGNDALQGIAFYPPTHFISPLTALDSVPATAKISAPTCFTGNTANAAVLCVLVVNDQLYAIGFNPQANTTSHLQPLSLGIGFTGAPSCAGGGGGVGVCAIRQGAGLLGFALNINGTLNAIRSMQLGAGSYLGDPSCAVPTNGVNPDGTSTATCAIVSSGVVLGISFNPQAATLSAFQSLGAAADGGLWTGAVACASFPDALAANHSMVSCGVVSSTSNLFGVTFDPRTGVSRGVNGPFGSGVNGKPSCIPLAVDPDEINCGSTTTAGTSSAVRMPVGLLPKADFAPIIAVLH